MKKGIKFIILIVIILLTGCSNSRESSDSEGSQTVNLSHLEQAFTHMNELTSVQIRESTDFHYKFLDDEVDFIVNRTTDIMQEPLKIKQMIDINGHSEEGAYYYTNEGNQFYRYKQDINDLYLKKQLTESGFNEEINDGSMIYLFTELSSLKAEEKSLNDFDKVYTLLFTLKDVSSDFDNVLKPRIIQLLNPFVDYTYDRDIINDVEIPLNIIINTKSHEIKKMEFDFSEIMELTFQSIPYFDNQPVEEMKMIHEFQFTQLNKTLVNVTELEHVEDLPDYYFETNVLFENHSVGYQLDNSELSSSSDVDVFKIEVSQPKKHLFMIKANHPIKANLINDQGENIRLTQVEEMESTKDIYIPIYLTEGIYYLVLTNTGYNRVTFSLLIDEIQTDDYKDQVFQEDPQPIKLIDQDMDIKATANYIGDTDVFQIQDLYDMIGSSEGFITISIKDIENLSLLKIKYNEAIGFYGVERIEPVNGVLYTESSVGPGGTTYYAVLSNGYLGDYTFEVNYYDANDDFPDRITESDDVYPVFRIEDTIREPKAAESDFDIFKLIIEEEGIYNFTTTVNGELRDVKGTLYDENRIQLFKDVGVVFSYNLKPGVYYLSLTARISTGMVEINSFRANDDYVDEIAINDENDHYPITQKGYISFLNDTDTFSIDLTEESYLSFDLYDDQDIFQKLIIKDASGKVVFKSDNDKLFGEDTYREFIRYSDYFYPGVYTIEVSGDYSNTPYTLKLTKDETIKDDYPYNHIDFDFSELGTLHFGNNIIQNDYDGDIDVYVLEIFEAGFYFINTNIKINAIKYHESSSLPKPIYKVLSLEPGIYYFYLEASDVNTQYSIAINLAVDDYPDEKIGQLIIGETLTAVNDFHKDIDRIAITITEPGLYYLEYSYEINFELYKEDLKIIYHFTNDIYGTKNMSYLNFEPGTYTFHFSNKYAEDQGAVYRVTINKVVQTNDVEPNNTGLSPDKYKHTISLDSSPVQFQFDYEMDTDVILVQIREPSYYYIQVDDAKSNLYNEDGTALGTSYLEPGDYYLLISQIYRNTIDYSIQLRKRN
jgi:hypothetical protein